jgi:hypothetical protein
MLRRNRVVNTYTGRNADAYDGLVVADFENSTLWRISAFERARRSLHEAGPPTTTQLSTTMLADLRRIEREQGGGDTLEVVAACLRHREPALLYVAVDPYVWALTVFPDQQLFHSPRDVADVGTPETLSRLRLVGVERATIKPPGHRLMDRVALERYRPLAPLVWALALHGPRPVLLSEIGGRAAYRLAAARMGTLPAAATGALASAVQRLHVEATSLRDMAHWPGMSVERASRLLNALYLSGALMVTRTHPAAREQPASWPSLLRRK